MASFNMNLLNKRLIKCQQHLIDSHFVPGNAIIIGDGNGVLFENYLGMSSIAKRIPMSSQTLFRMYSMTKIVTVLAALQLWEEGELQLDDPIAKYLPAYKSLSVWNGSESTPCSVPIRIRHLLTMTSGLSYLTEDMNSRQNHFIHEWDMANKSGNPWDTVKAMEKLAELPLVFEPGEQYLYGLSHDVLGAIIEVISGQTLEEYCRSNIFNPIGMSSACWSLPDGHESRLAECYTYENGSYTTQKDIGIPVIDLIGYKDISFFSGGAGLICTLNDYAKLTQALFLGGSFNDERIIGRKTLELMRTPHLNPTQHTSYCNPSFDPTTYGPCYSYGFGVRVLSSLPATTIGNIGEWGWSGALGTWMSIDPASDFWFVYAHQHAPADHHQFLPPILAAIYGSMI